MRFVTPDGDVDASAGDLMTVPPRAIHTFKNASDTEDCECYMTATPGMRTPFMVYSVAMRTGADLGTLLPYRR